MKYSVVMPYHKRAGHLHNTLVSFDYFYGGRKDTEIIIAEDIKNINDKIEHDLLIDTINKFPRLKIKRIDTNFANCYNPAPLFNLAVKESCGKYLLLTNPEGFHSVNILAGIDNLLFKYPNEYIVCGCLNVAVKDFFIKNIKDLFYHPLMWYQHSKHRNALFHFCSIISRENYDKIGGFDERFSGGYCYDDDDFRVSVDRAGIKFIVCDDLLSLHQNHKPVTTEIKDCGRLIERNKELYFMKLQKKSDEEINKFLENFK